MLGVLEARPGDRAFLLQAEAEGHVHRRLQSRPADLAVSLQRVPVAEVEQRAGVEDGQVDRRALAHVGRVHVAAEGPRPQPAELLLARRRHRDAPQHRRERHRDRLHPAARAGPPCPSCAAGPAARRSGPGGRARSGTRCASPARVRRTGRPESRPRCRGWAGPSAPPPPACRLARPPRSRWGRPRRAIWPPGFSYHSPQSDSLSRTSPGLTVSTGGRTANVAWPTVGFRRWVSAASAAAEGSSTASTMMFRIPVPRWSAESSWSRLRESRSPGRRPPG